MNSLHEDSVSFLGQSSEMLILLWPECGDSAQLVFCQRQCMADESIPDHFAAFQFF